MYYLSSLYRMMSNSLQADTQMFSCGVCFDEYPVAEKVLCGFDGCEAERHLFCEKCVVSHAKASTEEVQLAEGGFRCMEHGCINSILYSVAIQKLLPQNVKERLDERIMEEDLAKSGLILERCRDCNYAMEMEQSKKENMIFPCIKCQKQWCRICGREWNHEHQNVTCAQLDARKNIDKKKRELECKLNEAVIRKCECGLQFTKDDGCNKMTCRCGLTQCYLCREKNIDYNHFCQHVREPGITACPCGKKCTIWVDANKVDHVVIDSIYAEAAKNGINLNNGVKQNLPPKIGQTRRAQHNPTVVEYFQEVYRYTNRQIRDAAIHAEQQRQQTLRQTLHQIEQQRQRALDRAEQQRQQALRHAKKQRQKALGKVEQQRQDAEFYRELAEDLREHARYQAERRQQKAEQRRQQNAIRDEQLRQAFQQMGLRIQEGFRRIGRGIQNFFI